MEDPISYIDFEAEFEKSVRVKKPVHSTETITLIP